ncbi:unnamed protein product [Oikopleura dioica]|uniref:Uncharacterized protein n=1 Tax=Oikopleura dioica TaxID=34765 RepID=E4XV16_OIKDI|nr:unnamed protein product [Oikopleura dioica]
MTSGEDSLILRCSRSFLKGSNYCIFKCCGACFRTPEQGAQTSLKCICDSALTTGKYFSNLQEAPVQIRGVRKLEKIQADLWNITEDFLKGKD